MDESTSQYPIQISKSQNIWLFKPCEAHITSEGWGIQLRRVIAETLKKESADKPRVLLDMSMVEHVSSTFLGELIGLNRSLQQRNGQFRLGGITKSVEVIFRITRLDRTLRLFEDIPSAQASFDPV